MLFADKANCRNAANGLMKRKDGSGSENLTLITYDVLSEYEPQPFADEEGKLRWLSALGFTTVPMKICRTIQDVVAYRAYVMEIRKTIDYDIDGLVVKERTIDRIDAGRARPDRQIAFKFSLEEAVSVVRNVEWSISGATYTPVAVFDPVELAGTIVQRASLANPDTIRALGLKTGNHVVVVKRGEIIPKIESVVPGETENTSEILYPGNCETCGTALVDEGSRLYCPNRSCPKRILHQLLKWISVVDIRDFGDTLIRSLFESGKVRSISDLYNLDIVSLTPFFLNSESIASEKKSLGAEKVLRSIRSHTKLTLAAFVAGFDIEGIGETSVEKLVSAGIDTLDRLLSASVEQISSVYGFAEVMARSTVAGLAENAEEMQSLVSSGTIQLEERNAAGKLEGKSFCFTGELVMMKRAEAQNLVKQAGGLVKSSVTKDLTYLVTNDISSGSLKNRKAEELGVSIITEKEFLVLVKDPA
jgi:DNA ligase (NAD+)